MKFLWVKKIFLGVLELKEPRSWLSRWRVVLWDHRSLRGKTFRLGKILETFFVSKWYSVASKTYLVLLNQLNTFALFVMLVFSYSGKQAVWFQLQIELMKNSRSRHEHRNFRFPNKIRVNFHNLDRFLDRARKNILFRIFLHTNLNHDSSLA